MDVPAQDHYSTPNTSFVKSKMLVLAMKVTALHNIVMQSVV